MRSFLLSAVLSASALGLSLGRLSAAPAEDAPATIRVTLPADARLTINGSPTRSTSAHRLFVSPPLPAGKSFSYRLEAEFVRAGSAVRVERTVVIRAGRETDVSLDAPTEVVRGDASSSGPGSPETRSYYYAPGLPSVRSPGTSYVASPAGGAYGVPRTAGRDTAREDRPKVEQRPIFWGVDPSSPFYHNQQF